MARAHRKLLVDFLVVSLGKWPLAEVAFDVRAHLRNMAPRRKFDRRPYREIKVDVVLFKVIASPELVCLVNPKAQSNVGRPMSVGEDVAGCVDR